MHKGDGKAEKAEKAMYVGRKKKKIKGETENQ